MYIIGQHENLELINKWKDLPNFLIIQGDRHMGKSYLTLYLCEKFKLHYVKMNNSVNCVRDLINNMKPNTNILYHFKDFQEASLQAKNALLKITEEPIPGNYIVITGGPQIKTLQSRARLIIMNPYSQDELFDYMQPYFPEDDLKNKLILAGINSPAKINYFKDYPNLNGLVNFTFEIVNKITYLKIEDILEIMARFENRYEEIDAVALFLEFLINVIKYKIENQKFYSYNTILKIIIKGKQSLEREYTLKRKMLLYKIFYEIYNFNKKENMK